MGKKLISFSLFGENPKYLVGAVRNTELQPEIYPGWTCRFYVSPDVPQKIIKMLEKNSAEIIMMGKFADNGMNYAYDNPRITIRRCWRYLALDDKDFEACIFRDVDNRLSFFQKRMVDEWLASGKAGHIIRGLLHLKWPILAGEWGMRPGYLPNMRKLMRAMRLGFKGYQFDEDFLADKIYPRIKNNVLIHSGLTRFPGEVIVPTPPEYHLVGRVHRRKKPAHHSRFIKSPNYIEPVGYGDYSPSIRYKEFKSLLGEIPKGGQLTPLTKISTVRFWFLRRLLKPFIPRYIRNKIRSFKHKYKRRTILST